MSGSDFFGLWIHVLGLAMYGGCTLALVGVILPAAQQIADPLQQRRVLAGALRIYDPLMIAALGIILFSGMVNLTSYKELFRAEFFERMGWLLMWKLILAFLVIMVGTYMAFGLGHRIVRAEGLEDPADAPWLGSMIRRLQAAGILNLVLLAATAWLGLAMGHPLQATP